MLVLTCKSHSIFLVFIANAVIGIFYRHFFSQYIAKLHMLHMLIRHKCKKYMPKEEAAGNVKIEFIYSSH